MPDIFGATYDQALARVGSLDQFARVDSFVESEGAARGARRLRVVTGGGLEYDVHPDRALDIGAATFQGVPLAWLSSTGITTPHAYEPDGRGWLRTFGGGLMTTCGLDAFGPASTDADGTVGMHGRIGHVPARVTRAEAADGASPSPARSGRRESSVRTSCCTARSRARSGRVGSRSPTASRTRRTARAG